MDIFDPQSSLNPSDWLKEKALASLQSAVSLIDLANEPDTTSWYRKNLKRIGEHLISRLMPMNALLHLSGSKSVQREELESILEKGSFALAKWCRKYQVMNPYELYSNLESVSRDGKADEPEETVRPTVEDEEVPWLKLEIYSNMALKMMDQELTEPAKRLLSWLLYNLNFSEYADILIVSKTFLPTDIGCSRKETDDGYRLLYEKGIIEKVNELDISENAIAIRLTISGVNDSKHAPPYQEQTFGRPGMRIKGEPTVGNIFILTFDRGLSKYLEWLSQSPKNKDQLLMFLRKSIGEDEAYFDEVRIAEKVKELDNPVAIEIEIRYPFGVNDISMESRVKNLVEKWMKESMIATSK